MKFPEAIGLIFRGRPLGRIKSLAKRCELMGLNLTFVDMDAHLLCGGNPELVLDAVGRAFELGVKTDFNELCAIDLSDTISPLLAVEESVKIRHSHFDTISPSLGDKIQGYTKAGEKVCASLEIAYRLSPSRIAFGSKELGLQELFSAGVLVFINTAQTQKDLMTKVKAHEKELLSRGKSSLEELISLRISYK